MACMERLCPKGVTFFRPQVYERVGILLVEVYGKVGKSVILVCKKARGLINVFHFFLLGRGGGGLPQQAITFLLRGSTKLLQ